MRSSLSSRRFIALFTIASIAAIVMVTVIFLEKLRVKELKEAEDEAVSMARIIAEQTTRAFQGADLAMRVGLDLLEGKEAKGVPLGDIAVHDMLRTLVVNMPQIRSMFVVDAQGTLVNSSREFPMGRLYLADRDYFTVPREGPGGSLHIGAPLASRTDGTWTLHLSRAIRRQTGEFGGVIVVAVDLRYFEVLYQSIRLEGMSPISLSVSDGVLVARYPLDDTAIGKKDQLASFPREWPESHRPVAVRVEGGHPGVVAYDRIDQFPMILSVGNPDANALEEWDEFSRTVTAEVSVWVCLLLVAAILLWRHQDREDALAREARQTGNRLKALAAAAMDAIVTTDEHQRIVGINRAAERMFGYSHDRIVGQPVETLFSGHCPLGGNRFDAPGKESVDADPGNAVEEAVGLRADGSTFPVEMTTARATVGDEISHSAILRDISKRRATEEELNRSHAELRDLTAALQSIREHERTAIARELHDELGQQLMRLSMDLSWMTERLPGLSSKLHQRATDMMQVLGTTVDSLRQVTTRLRPPILDDLGLADAVRWQLDVFARSTDIAVDSNISVGKMDMDKHVATDVFRILQESLTNIARHASASKVQVSLTTADGSLFLEVRDDGCGMDLEGGIPRFSHGLVGIRERVLALGGSIDMSSTPRNGFAVRVQIPLVKPELPGDQK